MAGNILLDEIDVLERRRSSVLMIHRALCGVNKFVPLDLLLKDQTLDATTTTSYEYYVTINRIIKVILTQSSHSDSRNLHIVGHLIESTKFS
jgi:hypothetical protein